MVSTIFVAKNGILIIQFILCIRSELSVLGEMVVHALHGKGQLLPNLS